MPKVFRYLKYLAIENKSYQYVIKNIGCS